jgi:hypothetical protein
MVTPVLPGKCRRTIIQISKAIYQSIKENRIHQITGKQLTLALPAAITFLKSSFKLMSQLSMASSSAQPKLKAF